MAFFNNKIMENKKKFLIAGFSVVFVAIAGCMISAMSNYVETDSKNEVTSEIPAEENTGENITSDKDSEKEKKSSNIAEENEKKVPSSKEESNNKTTTPPNNSKVAAQDYTKLYPNLYCEHPQTQIIPEKTVYLTFDDGPSDRTLEILKILREKDVKATFFVTGSSPEKGKVIMKQIVDEGHAIGIHTYTHEFRQIYASVETYLDDFNKIYNLVHEATGIKPTIFRYPGGSNTTFDKHIRTELLTEMKRRGFTAYDWNLSVGDAVSVTPTPTQKCINNVLSYSKNCQHGVVLMHDAKPKKTTVEALPKIIDGLISQGFTLDKLSNNIDPTPYSLIKNIN